MSNDDAHKPLDGQFKVAEGSELRTGLPQQGDPEDQDKVTLSEKVGYGLGDTASNLYWKLFENFQLIFYTDVFGISAAAAGTMFFVTKLWDAINDPLVGFFADRTKTAWGRFRPYLVWGSLPFAVTGMLTFYTPDLPPTGKLIYAYITYTLVFMAYTFVNIPYSALMGVISSNSLERTSLSTFRFVLAFLGGLIVQKFTEPLVALFGGWEIVSKTVTVDGVQKVVEEVVVLNKQAGFFWTVVCYAIAAAILFLITFALTKERIVPKQQQNSLFRDDVRDLFSNRPWLVLLFVGWFSILAGWTRGSAIAYYFTYYVHLPFGNFLATATIASIVGMLFTRHLTAIFGKKILMIMLNATVAVLTSLFYFIPADQVAIMYGLNILIALTGGPIPVLLFSMYADSADYGDWVNHRRATGLVFSAATFSQKLGGALGAAIPGWMLAAHHFQEPIDGIKQDQSDVTLSGIVLMMSVMPAAFLLMGAGCLLFYNLTDQKLVQIESDLLKRKRLSDDS